MVVESEIVAAVPRRLYIDGEWREARSGARFVVEDPSNGETLTDVADAGPDDALDALDAAARAQPAWAKHAPRERGEILRRAYERMIANAESLAYLITLEMGKPLAEARAEVSYAAEFFRWFSEEAVRIGGSFRVAPNGLGRLLVMHQPVGPCVLITPWNFPIAMGTRKIGPAIAAGCTMIVKPAQQTPLSMLMLARLIEESGLPRGVLNVVTTTRASRTVGPLLADERVRKLSFTGSTEVGRALLAQASRGVLRTSMELGGNAPFLVFDDADLDAAVDGAMVAKMRNGGEACTAANRFYVSSKIANRFTELLESRIASLRVGRGTEPGVEIGPLIDDTARSNVHQLVQDAVLNGARLRVGGTLPQGPGHFYQPTLLDRVPPGTRLLRQEIFGPVAPIVTFDDEDEAIALANDTQFGLVAYAYTSDVRRAIRVVEALEVGMVGLNQGLVSNPAAPFGGVKQSGIGREGGAEGIHEYLETKYAAIAM